MYFLKTKDQVLQAFWGFVKWIERLTGCLVKSFQPNRAGEYLSEAFTRYLAKKGIQRLPALSNTPQENPVAEHFNRTASEGITAMLSAANMSCSWWMQITCLAAVGCEQHMYIKVHNFMEQKGLGGQCPWEVLHGKRVPEGAFNWIQTFGTRAYVILPESGQIDRKLAGRTEPMLYVGMRSNENSYLMYNPKTKRFLETREAIFDERILGLPGEEKKYGIEEPALLSDEKEHVEETRAPVRQPEKQQAVENERESSLVQVGGQRVAIATTPLRFSPCSVRREMAQKKGIAVVKQLFSEENQHI